ncbi:SLC13 family permease [Desulfogranum mediterraneum]|uniref:SLC13 family permease n=1 Tax=Desulfogranum mediterraneum TaxID=160661 RepID=UPI000491263A|nr:SLC13 family permease [Desulfogranum mediterraneum]
MLHPEAVITLVLLAATVGLLVTNLVRADLVAMLVVVALMVSKVLTVPEALSGFANPVVLIVGVMFIISEAVIYTGIAQRLGEWVVARGGSSELRLMVLLMGVAGLVGAFMSSTATAAIFIPVTIAVAEKAGLNHKRLLMPLAVAALISGMMTLVATSPNLVVNSVLREYGLQPLSFFAFTPFGLLILLVGVGFMALWGRHLLARESRLRPRRQGRFIHELTRRYGVEQQASLLQISAASPLIDRSVARVQLRERYGVNLIAIQTSVNGGRAIIPVRPETVFHPNDTLVLIGSDSRVAEVAAELQLQRLPLPPEPSQRRGFFQVIGAAEVMLTPESRLIGKSLRDIRFHAQFDCLVVGVRRNNQVVSEELSSLPLQFGDVLLVCGAWADIIRLRQHRNEYLLLTLPEDYREVIPAAGKAPLVLVVLGLMVGALVFNLLTTVTAVMAAGLALVLGRCVRADACYRLIDWQTVLLIAGILPLALALQKTAVSGMLCQLLLTGLGPVHPLVLLSVLFLLTGAVGLVLSSTPAAVLIAPIAVELGSQLGVSPQACGMIVAIACSAAFISPVGSPVNMIVRDPGAYVLGDYLKVGIPLFFLTMIAAVGLAWVRYLL